MSTVLSRAFSIDDLERLARRVLPRAVCDFYAGGAEGEYSLRANRDAFQALPLLPRVLTGAGLANTACTLLGAPAALPLAIAPMGAVGFGRRDGDVAIARAAAAAGIPHVLSTMATESIERVAEAGGRRWFQLYPLRHRPTMLQLVERARLSGYEALVVTVDVPVGGKRERDLRNDFSMPFRFTARNLLDFASRPRWALDMLARGIPGMPNVAGIAADAGTADPLQAAASVGREFDPAFGWADLAQLRRAWSGKLVLKGVLRADDALAAARLGCDAVIVSNHGGRQLDGAPATLAALAPVREALGPRVELLVDGGIRRGADIAKAIAAGADGVLVGRPALWGACVAGEAGVAHAIGLLQGELARTMTLCGLGSVADIGPELLGRPAWREADAGQSEQDAAGAGPAGLQAGKGAWASRRFTA